MENADRKNTILYRNKTVTFPDGTQAIFLFDATSCLNVEAEDITAYWYDNKQEKRLKIGELYKMSHDYYKNTLEICDGKGLNPHIGSMDLMGAIASNTKLKNFDKTSSYTMKYFSHISK